MSQNLRAYISLLFLSNIIYFSLLEWWCLLDSFLLQAAIRPPTFVFFVNDAKLFSETYRRYMEKQLRSDAGFAGTPIRLLWRSRKKMTKDDSKCEGFIFVLTCWWSVLGKHCPLFSTLKTTSINWWGLVHEKLYTFFFDFSKKANILGYPAMKE